MDAILKDEARAAEALPQTRAAIAALEAEPQDGDVEQALNRMDALLDPSLNLLAVSEDSITLQGCRADMLTIRRALRMAPVEAQPQPSAQGPKEIFLQLHGDCLPHETDLPVVYTDDSVTWCWHRINDSDVRYIRADLAATPKD